MDDKLKIYGLFIIILIGSVFGSAIATYYFVKSTETETNYSLDTDDEVDWTIPDITGLTFNTTGNSTYFVLQVGWTLVLTDGEDLVIMNVTDQTHTVSSPYGDIETRVFIEDEFEDGERVETSYNWFAYCNETGDIWYFGEEVQEWEDGESVPPSGEWEAFVDGALPGILHMNYPIVGARFYQEYYEDEAMDRAEIISVGATCTVPVGEFDNCMITEESNPLEPYIAYEYKYYAPNIGLICEEDIVLVDYGFNIDVSEWVD